MFNYDYGTLFNYFEETFLKEIVEDSQNIISSEDFDKTINSENFEINNEMIFYINSLGLYNKKNTPAVKFLDSSEWWYRYGFKHRINGPAIIETNKKEYWLGGKKHREDGAAIEYNDGFKEYWFCDALHRVNGPAKTRKNEYYLEGERLNINEEEQKHQTISGNIYYFKQKLLHRENGAAIEYKDGSKEYWVKGKRHKEDGPAIDYINGRKEWYRYGELHREDGPAIIDHVGIEYWYRYGELHREDGPAIIHNAGDKYWNERELSGENVSSKKAGVIKEYYNLDRKLNETQIENLYLKKKLESKSNLNKNKEKTKKI